MRSCCLPGPCPAPTRALHESIQMNHSLVSLGGALDTTCLCACHKQQRALQRHTHSKLVSETRNLFIHFPPAAALHSTSYKRLHLLAYRNKPYTSCEIPMHTNNMNSIHDKHGSSDFFRATRYQRITSYPARDRPLRNPCSSWSPPPSTSSFEIAFFLSSSSRQKW